VSEVTEVTEVTDHTGKARALYDVRTFLERFIAYPHEDAAVAHTLWIAHTHAVGLFDNTPRIAFLSPEPGSGKSRALEITELLVPRPVLSVNASTAYIFRKISDEAGVPTLLLDEVDAIFSGGKSDSSEDLRGLLNSGYRRGATAGRAAIRGKEIVTEEWPSFCPVALAGLNQLPDTLMTRSVIVGMKRRRHDQHVEPYRRRVHEREALDLYEALETLVAESAEALENAWPTLPESIQDRDADVWEPLVAIADAAGGDWSVLARVAAERMVADAKNKPATLGIRLLADIRTAVGTEERISTGELLNRLHNMESAPWGSIKGEPIDARFLARTLNKYEIETNNTLKINGIATKGYAKHHFADAWDRYLPTAPVPSEVGNRGNPGNPTPETEQWDEVF
jgi:hypothetical protein